jgi:hypothetical protein
VSLTGFQVESDHRRVHSRSHIPRRLQVRRRVYRREQAREVFGRKEISVTTAQGKNPVQRGGIFKSGFVSLCAGLLLSVWHSAYRGNGG